MKYGIQLISKYTGKSGHILGSLFNSQEEAERYFENEVCTRCNRMQLVYAEDFKDLLKQSRDNRKDNNL